MGFTVLDEAHTGRAFQLILSRIRQTCLAGHKCDMCEEAAVSPQMKIYTVCSIYMNLNMYMYVYVCV